MRRYIIDKLLTAALVTAVTAVVAVGAALLIVMAPAVALVLVAGRLDPEYTLEKLDMWRPKA